MSRARATALALVNWKGVFYERYLLDRHVTALEGANGAGKTTVMVAAYVALLPDMARLRFTNVGESGATGGDKGVWGRLGSLGGPSYTALEIRPPDGTSVIAGVRLERGPAPTVTLTPFLVDGLDLEGRMRELLLVSDGDDHVVPRLEDVRANAERRGGRLTTFGSAKEYFAALFERGLTPLRLATDEERNKMNEMLRTSMTGGISRALTNELRVFLLKEESGLGDALTRMRANLDACHRSRIEVLEARRLEQEIRGVYDAGEAMFAAAALALQADAEERGAEVREARAAVARAEAEAAAAERARSEAAARATEAAAETAASRHAYDEALAHSERVGRAVRLEDQARGLEGELEAAAATADALRATRDAAAATRERRRAARASALEDVDRAARGMADLESGIDELYRHAHAFRHVRARLEHARTLLGAPDLGPDDVDQALADARPRLAEADAARRRLDRDRWSFDARRRDHTRALEALEAIEAVVGATDDADGDDAAVGEERPAPDGGDGPLPEGDEARARDDAADDGAYRRARRAIARLARRDTLASRAASLDAERAAAAALARRQSAARAAACTLAVATDGSRSAADDVRAALAAAEDELRAAEQQEQTHLVNAADARRRGDDARAARDREERAASVWNAAAARAARLASAVGVPVRSRVELDVAHARVASERERAHARETELAAQRDALRDELAALDSPFPAIHPELARLRDELDAELLGARFEDLDVAEAGRVQAELGPLVDALVVADVDAALAKLADRPRELASVWLVAASAPPIATASTREARSDVVVGDSLAVRVTRIPDRPTLGRRARTQRTVAVRARLAELDAAVDNAAAAARDLDTLARDAERLLDDADCLERPSPDVTRLAHDATITSAAAVEDASLAEAQAARGRAADVRRRVDALRALAADAHLLDPPDYGARERALAEAHAEAIRAAADVPRLRRARATLSELVEVLREPALVVADGLDERRDAFDAECARLFELCRALEDVAHGRGALHFADAETALSDRRAFAPALGLQLDAARAALRACEEQAQQADAAWEAASSAVQQADALRDAVAAQLARVRADLAMQAAPSSAPALAAALRDVAQRHTGRDAAEARERREAEELARWSERRAQADAAVQHRRRELEERERLAAPAAERWSRARAALEAGGHAPEAIMTRFSRATASRSSAALAAESRSRAELLVERLEAAGGADAALGPVRAFARGSPPSPDNAAQAWSAVQQWIRRRLPAPLAESTGADSFRGLEKLRDELASVSARLARQEVDLRGASEDIARGIDVQLRRAAHQVRRLNQQLGGVSFGSIAGIRVSFRRIERMDQLLRALREGAAQELLFQSQLPIEQALDEVFRKYGGGRAAGGAARVLDYREYLELGVEVRRRAAASRSEPGDAGEGKVTEDAGDAPARASTERSGEWEPASPARLSTGEAIGVGAALMMVILTEWERDAAFLRQKRASGSLRLLFLDEANRLSHDNLAVLFDLCRSLDLQLLIAAPEVAPAEGSTTYRLVRSVGEGGREEVMVSGRRTGAGSPMTGAPQGSAPERWKSIIK